MAHFTAVYSTNQKKKSFAFVTSWVDGTPYDRSYYDFKLIPVTAVGPTLNIASDNRTVGLTNERTIKLGLGLGVRFYSDIAR